MKGNGKVRNREQTVEKENEEQQKRVNKDELIKKKQNDEENNLVERKCVTREGRERKQQKR